MRDLLILLNQIQSLWNRRVVLVLVLPDLEQDLNHILTPLADRSLVKDGPETLKDGVVCFWTVFGQKEADFSHEPDCYFDGVVRGSVQAQEHDLKGDDLVCDELIAEMGDKCRGGVTDDLLWSGCSLGETL